MRDRFERSGMRWTSDMAEAMLKLRANTLRSDDPGEYLAWTSIFIQQDDQQRLFPKGQWTVVLK
ncbi:MAG: hypothetical protein ACRDJU_09960 [Actinomycetota bacterium]